MSSSSRVRYRVVGFMLALGAGTYLDRACIATLAPDIRRDPLLSQSVERVTRCGVMDGGA